MLFRDFSYITKGNECVLTIEENLAMQVRARELLSEDNKTKLKEELKTKYDYRYKIVIRGLQNLLDELECECITEFSIKNESIKWLFNELTKKEY